jgi:N-acetylneuraminic acid mutarotase
MKKRTSIYDRSVPFKTIFILLGMGMFSITFAQDSPWIKKAAMNTGRQSYAASVVNNKVYVIGGRYTLSLVTEYDPATDTWTTKATMPTPRMTVASGVGDGKIYAIGGITAVYQPALSTVEEYDPATDTWTTKTPMPTGRGGHATAVVNGMIYIIGGMTSGPNFWSGIHNTVEVYDPLTDNWSTKTDIPTARVWLTTSVVDGKIYAIGGLSVTKEPLSTVEVYDPATDTWTTKTPMPTARGGHAAAVVNGMIYIIGGGTENGQPVGGYSLVEAYNPVTDTWTRKADIPQPRAGLSAGVVDGKIYAIGGIPTFADPHLGGVKTVYEYDPSKDLAALINQFNINKCYLMPGIDSVCITTKLIDPTGVTLVADIEAPDQTTIDTIQLFDDGNHHDGNAGDSLYANVWPVGSEERHYYMDLQITQVDTDTITNQLDNMAQFTTIGPVVIEEYTFSSSDTEPNPGDELSIKLTLKNEGSSATAANVKARLICPDSMVTVFTDTDRPFYDIKPGESRTSITYYRIEISENCPDNVELQFKVEISSNDIPFWEDTFSMPVVSPETGIHSNSRGIENFSLGQNYPNPFNPETSITFDVQKTTRVKLKVLNMQAQVVRTLVDREMTPGSYQAIWDGRDSAGIPVVSGTYLCQYKADSFHQIRKMVLIR